MATKLILDTSNAFTISEIVRSAAEDEGFEPSQVIPGLIRAIHDLVELTNAPDILYDEAMDLLEQWPDDED